MSIVIFTSCMMAYSVTKHRTSLDLPVTTYLGLKLIVMNPLPLPKRHETRARPFLFFRQSH